MPKTRKQKEESVEALSGVLKGANNVTFVGFSKLKVVDERALRKNLRESGSSYTVAKKSLFTRALKALGFDVPEYEGQLAIAYGADTIAPAKGIAEFAKKHEGVMSILGGIFEGKLVDASKMNMIATIPTREVLLGMLANVLSAPMRGLAIAVDAVAKKK
mgnify:CR=1 FL=1